ncbi:MAG: response regulator transcription factor [Dongiaceae bacterium]
MRVLILTDQNDSFCQDLFDFVQTQWPQAEVTTAPNLGHASHQSPSGPPDYVVLDMHSHWEAFLPPTASVNSAIANVALPQSAAVGEALAALNQHGLTVEPITSLQQDIPRLAGVPYYGEKFAYGLAEEETPFIAAPAANDLPQKLSPREYDVLRYLLKGMSNKQIARELGLQEITIKVHLSSIFRKLNVRNRTHAATVALQKNLVAQAAS